MHTEFGFSRMKSVETRWQNNFCVESYDAVRITQTVFNRETFQRGNVVKQLKRTHTEVLREELLGFKPHTPQQLTKVIVRKNTRYLFFIFGELVTLGPTVLTIWAASFFCFGFLQVRWRILTYFTLCRRKKLMTFFLLWKTLFVFECQIWHLLPQFWRHWACERQ